MLFLQGAHLEISTFFANVKHPHVYMKVNEPRGTCYLCVMYVWHVVHHGMHAICVYPPRVQHLINRSLETCAHHVRLIINAAWCGPLRACADCRNHQQQFRKCSKMLSVVIHKPNSNPGTVLKFCLLWFVNLNIDPRIIVKFCCHLETWTL